MLNTQLTIQTKAKSFTNIAAEINAVIKEVKQQDGLCNLFIKHTSCSLIISENADPDVLLDLENFMLTLVPEDNHYRHNAEGKDDMPAHIRSVLTQTHLTIPVNQGRLDLGTWQAVYLWEHRDHAHQRKLVVSVF